MVMRIICWIACALINVEGIYYLKDIEKIREGLPTIAYFSKCLIFIPFLCYGEVNMGAIKKMITSLDDKLGTNSKRKVIERDCVLVLLWLIAIVINYLILIYWMLIKNLPIGAMNVLKNLSSSIHFHGSIVTVMFLHVSICYRIKLIEKETFEKIEQVDIEAPLDESVIPAFDADISELTAFKLSLNHLFGAWLFPIFSQFVLCTCVTLVFVAGSGKFSTLKKKSPINYGQLAIINFVFILVLDHYHYNRPDFKMILTKFNMIDKENDPAIASFRKSIDEYFNTCYTVLNLFKLDRSALWGFFASILYLFVNIKVD